LVVGLGVVDVDGPRVVLVVDGLVVGVGGWLVDGCGCRGIGWKWRLVGFVVGGDECDTGAVAVRVSDCGAEFGLVGFVWDGSAWCGRWVVWVVESKAAVGGG